MLLRSVIFVEPARGLHLVRHPDRSDSQRLPLRSRRRFQKRTPLPPGRASRERAVAECARHHSRSRQGWARRGRERANNFIARSLYSGCAFFDGHVFELLLYARAVDVLERESIEAYLQTKWLPSRQVRNP